VKSLSRWANFSVSLLQWHRQSDDLLIFIALSISESIRQSVHVQLVSLLQWHLSSMQWSTSTSLYLSVNQFVFSSRATSESASMTSILNAMIYSLSSFYSSVNLIIRSRATSEPATMTSSKSISSMSKSISESASMTSSMQWSSHHSTYQWIDSPISSRATSESATMTSSKSISSMSKSISESASMTLLSCIVNLLQ